MSGEHVDAALFTPEINFGGLSDPSFAKDFGTKSRIVESSKLEIAYKEPKLRASLSCQNSNSIWILPVKTVSLSEEGFESNLQGISILPNYYIEAKSGEAVLKASIDLQVNST